jgi:hypothetical protein
VSVEAGIAQVEGPATWTPVLSPALARRAIEVARASATRLRDSGRVARAVAIAPTQTAFPRTVNWRPESLAQGEAGIALSCAYLDGCLPDEGWDRTGHQYLTVAAASAEGLPAGVTGMFGGLAGVAFAARLLSRGGARYRRLLATLDEALLAPLAAQADDVVRRGADGLQFGGFDVISGLAGAGAYLLCRRDDGAPAAVALDAVLRALVRLARDPAPRPCWWTPPQFLGDQDMTAMHPYGNLNCGLAHGIPGPLALLSIASSRGISVPDQDAAIVQAADWLAAHRADDEWGVNWPFAVPLQADGQPDFAHAAQTPSRAAWCYGAPGVARALWLAGVAHDRSDWRDLAVAGMDAIYRRPVAVRRIDSPTFCHGVAGLLHVTLRFAHETRLPVFAAAAADLTEAILAAYEPDSLLGYRNWEPGGARIDQAGLLDGSPGVILALLAASTDVEPAWDRAFMLA